jgi:putative ABC transport system permease protein
MFRHKGRLLLTQVVLITAGASFLMVMSLNSSLDLTLDNYFGRLHYDTRIYFDSMERGDQINLLAESVSGVEKVELDYGQQANLFLEGQQVKDAGLSTNIRGIRAGSDFYEPLMVAGRWLTAQDVGRELVIPRQTAEDYKINLGDMITLDLGVYGKDDWQVIGL